MVGLSRLEVITSKVNGSFQFRFHRCTANQDKIASIVFNHGLKKADFFRLFWLIRDLIISEALNPV